MKRKETNERVRISKYYITDCIRGFWGENNEGNLLLKQMKLPEDIIPFSIAIFLRKRRICWKDGDGNTASISFKVKPDQIECRGSYLGKRKSIRLFCEWGNHENQEMIARLESEAIGNLCMECIYENLIE